MLHADRAFFVSPSETRLVAGLGAFVLGTALLPFSMIGLLGVPLELIAVGMLVAAFVGARSPSANGVRAALSVILFVAALSAIGLAAVKTVSISYCLVLRTAHPEIAAPTNSEWLLTAVLCVAAGISFGTALWLWCAWSLRRCSAWAAMYFFACPAALALAWLLRFPVEV